MTAFCLRKALHPLAVASALFVMPTDAMAASGIEVLLRGTTQADDQEGTVVELRVLNSGEVTDSVELPDQIEAQIDNGDGERTVVLVRAPDTPASLAIAPHEYAKASYRLPAEATYQNALLSIPAWSAQAIKLVHLPTAQLAKQDVAHEPPVVAHSTPPPTDRTVGNAFVDNLTTYQPIYAAMGTGTNSDARIQLSLKYRLFGSDPASDDPQGWYLAYTQRMFWDITAKSSPFRNIDFQPEVLYITPSAQLKSGVTLVGQAGFRHESNGRNGDNSRSINSIYAMPMAAIPLAGGYDLTIAPQISFYVGSKSGNPDIARYRGHGALFLEVGKDDGLRLSTLTHLNTDSGKGSVNATLSYPLPRLLKGSPDFYLFAQSFTGYGENLLDYNRRTSRLRIGIALVR